MPLLLALPAPTHPTPASQEASEDAQFLDLALFHAFSPSFPERQVEALSKASKTSFCSLDRTGSVLSLW